MMNKKIKIAMVFCLFMSFSSVHANIFDDIGHAFSSAAKSVGHAFSSAAKTVGHGVTTAFNKASNAVYKYFTACQRYQRLKRQKASKEVELNNKQAAYQHELDSITQEQKQYKQLHIEYTALQQSVAESEKVVQQAEKALVAARKKAFDTFVQGSIWLKGRVGNISNKTSNVSFKLLYQKNGKTVQFPAVIAPGQTQYIKMPLQSMSSSNGKVAGMMGLVPYVDGQQVSKSHAESELIGRMYGILFNVQSVNSPGHPYGYKNGLCVTRMYPEVATRAHCISLATGLFVQPQDYWEFDIEVDTVVNGLAYPRITAIRTQAQVFNPNSDIVDLASATINEKTVAVTKGNSSSAWSYPNWNTSTGKELWQDL